MKLCRSTGGTYSLSQRKLRSIVIEIISVTVLFSANFMNYSQKSFIINNNLIFRKGSFTELE